MKRPTEFRKAHTLHSRAFLLSECCTNTTGEVAVLQYNKCIATFYRKAIMTQVIKAYLNSNEIGMLKIDPTGQADYVPKFNQHTLQRIIVEIDDKFGKDNWTSFEYIKEAAAQ